jgi:hypothetical protein
LTWDDFENGIREKHPTRSEARRIGEERSFRKFIDEECLPHWSVFQNCSFEAQEGLAEAEWQLIRAKMRSVKGSIGTMFGPRSVVSEKEMERRRAVAEQAQVHYQLLKATQLISDAIHWRIADKRLQEEEYNLLRIDDSDLRLKFERETKRKTLRKCIQKLVRLVKPFSPERPDPVIGFGLMPSGRSTLHAITKSYGLEGEPVDDELIDEHQHEEPEPMAVEDSTDLYYLCEKDTPEQVEAEMEATWDLCLESQVYKTCLSIRRHVYTNTMPQLKDKKKQALLDESEAQRDRNDWILDPKHVYRRSILRKKMPQWTNSTEKMESWYRPIWDPKLLRKQ